MANASPVVFYGVFFSPSFTASSWTCNKPGAAFSLLCVVFAKTTGSFGDGGTRCARLQHCFSHLLILIFQRVSY